MVQIWVVIMSRQRVVPVLEQIRNLNHGAAAEAAGGLLATSAVHSEGEYELILKRAKAMKGKPSQAETARKKMKKKKKKAEAAAAAAAAVAAGGAAAPHPDHEHADVGTAVFKTAMHEKTPQEMDPEELVAWLEEHRLGVFSAFFREHAIDGDTIAVLESTDVDAWGVGIPLERRKLLTLLSITISEPVAAVVAPPPPAAAVDFTQTEEYAAFMRERQTMMAQIEGMQGALSDAEKDARSAHEAEAAAREALEAQSRVQAQMQKSLTEAKTAQTAAPTGISGAISTLGESIDDTVHSLWDYKRTLHERAWELGGNIRVLCRVRPILPHEKVGTGSALATGARAKRSRSAKQSKSISAVRFGDRGHKLFLRKHEGGCR